MRTGLRFVQRLPATGGRGLGDQAVCDFGPRPWAGQQISAVCVVLTAHGYEPRPETAIITLANCPFDALARDHTELICGMNLALLGAVADQVGHGTLTARLDPADDRCCVVLDTH